MNTEKLFYVVASTILITVFILFTYLFSSNTYKDSFRNKEKVIYYVDHISSAHKKLIDIFNERYKGQIRVETINLTFDKFSTNERKDLLARYLRSKSPRIDLFSVDIIWVPRFRKWSKPLTSFIDSNFVSRLIPNTAKTCIVDDTIYAIPLYTDIGLMFYREDLLKKIPEYKKFQDELQNSITWERFIELKKVLDKRLNRENKPFYIFQADDYEGLMCSFIEVLGNLNNPLIDKKNDITLENSSGKKSIQLLIDLVHKYKISPVDVCNLRENESYRYFSDKDAFAVRGWPSFLSKDNNYVSSEILKNINIVPTPHLSGTEPKTVFGGWNLMISKYSNKTQEVIKFIEFLVSSEAQKILYEEGGYLPINASLYTDSVFIKKHPELKFYQKLFNQGVHRPLNEFYTTYSDIISFHLSNAIKSNSNAEKVVENIYREIREKLLTQR